MKILFVLEHYYPYIGGAEKLFKSLAEALVQQGHYIDIITSKYNNTLPTTETINGVNIHRVQCYNRFLFTVWSIPKVISLSDKCDVIHTTSYNASFPAWVGAKVKRKPIMITFHEVWGKLWFKLPFISLFMKTVYYLYEQFILKLSFDKFIAVSDFTAYKLQQAGKSNDKIVRIYNGLDYTNLEKYSVQKTDHFTFTYFGRLGISKGLNLLIPAIEKFLNEHPDCRAIIIIPRQPKKLYNRIIKLIEHHHLTDKIELKHDLTRVELYTVISQSDCVVIPSYSEGFCYVAAESIALNLPVISSNQGALKEVVSGPHLKMNQMTEDELIRCLNQAHQGEWLITPKKYFRFTDSVQSYLDLYRSLQSNLGR